MAAFHDTPTRSMLEQALDDIPTSLSDKAVAEIRANELSQGDQNDPLIYQHPPPENIDSSASVLERTAAYMHAQASRRSFNDTHIDLLDTQLADLPARHTVVMSAILVSLESDPSEILTFSFWAAYEDLSINDMAADGDESLEVLRGIYAGVGRRNGVVVFSTLAADAISCFGWWLATLRPLS